MMSYTISSTGHFILEAKAPFTESGIRSKELWRKREGERGRKREGEGCVCSSCTYCMY